MRSTSMTLHHNTPEVAVTGHFGAVKALRFLRAPKQASARILTSHTYFNPLTRTTTLYGARPLAGGIPDAISTATLSDHLLRLHTVDGDSTLTLCDAAGRALWSKNAQHTVSAVVYESVVGETDDAPLAGRPLTMSEQPAGAISRIREQYTYAPANEAAWREKNLVGSQVEIRHNAGINRQLSVSITGQLQALEERLLKIDVELPDWAVNTQADTDGALTRFMTHDATRSPLISTNAADVTSITAYDVSGAATHSRLEYSTMSVRKEAIALRGIRYRADGAVLSQTTGNGIVHTYEYDPRAQHLTRCLTERPPGNALGQLCVCDLHSTYDPAGNIEVLEDKGADPDWHNNQQATGVRKYSYDTLYRLTSASGRERSPVSHYYSRLNDHAKATPDSTWMPYSEHYTYDDGDNLIVISHNGGSGSRTRNLKVAENSNRALLDRSSQSPEFGFQIGGLQRELADGRLLSWYADSQLRQVSLITRAYGEPSDAERYLYADGGKRVRKISSIRVSGRIQTSLTTYAGGCEERQRLFSSQTIVQKHIIISEVGGVRLAENRINENILLRYSFSDHLGNICGETDEHGKITAREEYAPYGGTVGSDEDIVELSNLMQRTNRFSGKTCDMTGLYYYGWRYYQWELGRWLSADPDGTADGVNMFQFVRSNPLNFHDPDGREANAVDVVLVYGMGKARDEYFARKQPDSPIRITIDMLNFAIGLHEGIDPDYKFKKLQTKSKKIERRHIKRLTKEQPKFNNEAALAKQVLESWSNYLHQNNDHLHLSKKIRLAESSQKLSVTRKLLQKNLEVKPGDPTITKKREVQLEESLSGYLKTLERDSKFSTPDSEDAPELNSAMMASFFRKTSKLGLDWASSKNSPIKSIDFVNSGYDKTGQLIDLSLVPSAGKRTFPDSVKELGNHFFPLTFSELRHAHKKSIPVNKVNI